MDTYDEYRAALTLPGTTDEEKVKAINEIDLVAGTARAKYLTLAQGQEITYIKKEADAEAFKAAGYPEGNIANYPWVQAESIAQSDTGQQVTDLIIAQRDVWLVVGVKIEKERIKGKVQVNQQMGLAGIDSAKSSAIAILNAI